MRAGLEQMAAEGRFDRQVELVGEHWSSCRHLWLEHAEPLRAARLGDDLDPHVWWGTGLPGIASIKPLRNGRFKFDDAGLEALILPVFDTIPGLVGARAERHVEELRDLVAVDVDHPDRYWRRRGKAVVLGNAFLEIAGQEFEPVPVFSTPVSWLRSSGAGIVVLDWCYIRDLLLDRELIAEDVDLGNRLAAVLKPEILVMVAAA